MVPYRLHKQGKDWISQVRDMSDHLYVKIQSTLGKKLQVLDWCGLGLVLDWTGGDVRLDWRRFWTGLEVGLNHPGGGVKPGGEVQPGVNYGALYRVEKYFSYEYPGSQCLRSAEDATVCLSVCLSVYLS